MYVLKIIGARRSTLAYHQFDNYTDLREMIRVYEAIGYAPEALVVEERQKEQAA